MTRAIMCDCGCKSIITDINPKTGRVYAKCESSRTAAKTRATKNRNRQRKEMTHARTGSGSLIYDTRAWRRLSDKKRTVNPFCESCEAEGRYVMADIVDHIEEVKDKPELAYRWENLKSLCHRCHNSKTKDVASARNGGGGSVFVFG